MIGPRAAAELTSPTRWQVPLAGLALLGLTALWTAAHPPYHPAALILDGSLALIGATAYSLAHRRRRHLEQRLGRIVQTHAPHVTERPPLSSIRAYEIWLARWNLTDHDTLDRYESTPS